jgi:excisionase family DNA binding protein
MTPVLLSVPAAARALTISRATLCRYMALRQIAVVRLGRSVRIAEAEIARFVQERTQPAVKVWRG